MVGWNLAAGVLVVWVTVAMLTTTFRSRPAWFKVVLAAAFLGTWFRVGGYVLPVGHVALLAVLVVQQRRRAPGPLR